MCIISQDDEVKLTLTRSTLVKWPPSSPACNSDIDASYRSGKFDPISGPCSNSEAASVMTMKKTRMATIHILPETIQWRVSCDGSLQLAEEVDLVNRR